MNDYPPNWAAISKRIKDAANWRCERCTAANNFVTREVLTVHHLDGDKSNCADWNLAALCQRCHLRIQARVVMPQNFFETILPVARWFKPHLDGYRAAMAAKGQETALAESTQ